MRVPSPGFWIVLGAEIILPPTRGRSTRVKSGRVIFNLTLIKQEAASETGDFGRGYSHSLLRMPRRQMGRGWPLSHLTALRGR